MKKQTLLDRLKDKIENELKKQGKDGIIVWYDRGGTFENIVKESVPQGINLITYEGSYLALRHKLESKSPDLTGRWVLYIPEEKPEESWLFDLEKLGTLWEMDLLEYLKKEFGVPIGTGLENLLARKIDNAKALVRKWDSLLGDKEKIDEEAIVAALLTIRFELPQWNLSESILKFLIGEVSGKDLKQYGLWDSWLEKVKNLMGWEEIPDDEKELKDKLELTLLLTELDEFAPEIGDKFPEIVVRNENRESLLWIVKRWRKLARENYIKVAKGVEAHSNIKKILINVTKQLENAETFPMIDHLWLETIRNSLSPSGEDFISKVGRIKKISNIRSRLFWTKVGEFKFWEPIDTACELGEQLERIVDELSKIDNLEDLINSYTSDGGWWKADFLALELSTKEQILGSDDRKRFIQPVWNNYINYLDSVNRKFMEFIKDMGWKPDQQNFWNLLVKNKKRTAVLMIDALRFDLAEHLKNLIDKMDYKVSLRHFKGFAPSITPIGMSTLLPGAEEGIEVREEGGELKVYLGGLDVTSRQQRIKWMRKKLGENVVFSDIDNIDKIKLAKDEGAKILVVFSQELDTYGTYALKIEPEGLLRLLEKIREVIEVLKDSGYRRIVIGTDHGFLFIPEGFISKGIKEDAPGFKKARYFLGKTAEGVITKKAEELGLMGNLRISFPLGIATYRRQGEKDVFIHGGLSLQECVVPVLEIEVRPTIEKVVVKMELPKEITSRILSIKLYVEPAELISKPRRVKVILNEVSSEVIELGVNHPQEIVRVSWLEFDESPPECVRVRLLDADTGEVLDEVEVPVEMAI